MFRAYLYSYFVLICTNNACNLVQHGKLTRCVGLKVFTALHDNDGDDGNADDGDDDDNSEDGYCWPDGRLELQGGPARHEV